LCSFLNDCPFEPARPCEQASTHCRARGQQRAANLADDPGTACGLHNIASQLACESSCDADGAEQGALTTRASVPLEHASWGRGQMRSDCLAHA